MKILAQAIRPPSLFFRFVPKQMNRNKMKKWEDNTTCPFFIINKGQTNFDDLKFILVSDA